MEGPSKKPAIKAPSNLIRLPKTRQATNFTCGVAALQSILYYYGDEFREDRLAEKVKAGPEWGTGYRDIIEFAKSLGYDAFAKTGWTLQEVKHSIDKGIPVMVAFQAWSEETEKRPWKERKDDGHYAVIVGYDQHHVFFMDPSTLGNYAYISFEEFEDRWHDSDGRDLTDVVIHLGLSISKPKSAYDPEAILKLD